MKRLKRFNEIQEQPTNQVESDSLVKTYGVEFDSTEDIIKFEEFSEHRLDGATTITNNAEEKGGDALLTYHHFKVKIPYYEQAVNGKFNSKMAEAQYKDLVDELATGGLDFEQIEFQEIMGKIEVLGELLIKSKDLI
jgi:predicted xylose isomerase-like sugar epimerase